MRHGRCKMHFTKGQYEGVWQEGTFESDKMHGTFTVHYPDGRIETEVWVHGSEQ